mgnify:CR=1 FL=1
MGLSRLSERCRKCRYVDTCDHKEMEGLLMAEAGQPAAAAPVLATDDTVTIHLDSQVAVTIDGDQIRRKIAQAVVASMMGGA